MIKNLRVLYISYDGMTDSLGQSQVIPYLLGGSERNIEYHLISFDKPEQYRKNKSRVEQLLKGRKIYWYSLVYHKFPPIISTILDLREGWKLIKDLHRDYNFNIVHCRGYITAILGLRLKEKYDVKFIFDMRGWWPDEKLESGLWASPIFKPVYNYFKKMEHNFFSKADKIISLTHKGKERIVNKYGIEENRVGVIPTCVDFKIFKEYKLEIRNEVREELNLPLNEDVIIYSGSIGANYPPLDILSFYKRLSAKTGAYLLILTKEDPTLITDELNKVSLDSSKIRFASCEYEDVYRYLIASDIGIILYRIAFSTIGRSPTKLGEYWACGVTVISISGIGDLNTIKDKYQGVGLELLDDVNSSESVDVQFVDKEILRKNAIDYFDINKGIDFYCSVYRSL